MERHALYVSRFVSQAGQGLFLGMLVMVGGGSSTAALGLTSILVGMVAASLLLGAPAGILVDRLGAHRALLLGGLLRLGTVASAFLVIDAPQYVALVAFAYSAASQIFSPAELALVRCVRPTGARGTHAALLALQYSGQGVGVLLAAPLLYVLGGAGAMVAGATGAYVLVVALGLGLALRRSTVSALPGASMSRTWSEAIDYFRREPRGAYAAGSLTFAEVTTKCLSVALPFYLLDQLDLSSPQLGAIVVLGGTSALVGLAWSARSFTMPLAERAMKFVLMATVTSVLALAGLGWTFVKLADYSNVSFLADLAATLNPGFLVALPVAVVLGISFTVSRIGARTVLSETAPATTQGTVFAVQGTVTDVVVILPLLAVGVLAGYAGPRAALILVAAVGVSIFMLLEWVLPRLQGSTDASALRR